MSTVVKVPPLTNMLLTLFRLLRKIATGVRSKVAMPLLATGMARSSELGRNNFNLKTVAILPTTWHVPITAFTKQLHAALEGIGSPTLLLNQASVTQHLGRHAFMQIGKLKVVGWLAELEQQYRIMLYVVDSPVNSPWTPTCMRQVGGWLRCVCGARADVRGLHRLTMWW